MPVPYLNAWPSSSPRHFKRSEWFSALRSPKGAIASGLCFCLRRQRVSPCRSTGSGSHCLNPRFGRRPDYSTASTQTPWRFRCFAANRRTRLSVRYLTLPKARLKLPTRKKLAHPRKIGLIRATTSFTARWRFWSSFSLIAACRAKTSSDAVLYVRSFSRSSCCTASASRIRERQKTRAAR